MASQLSAHDCRMCNRPVPASTRKLLLQRFKLIWSKFSIEITINYQRWSPRGHILKSLALALASRPQVLENWPVLGSRTARFFGMIKFCGALEKFFGKRFLVKTAWKVFVKTFFFFFFFFFWRSPEKFLWRPFFFSFFWRALALCVLGPWPRAFLSLASRVSVLGKAVLGLGLEFFLCPWPWPRALCPRLHLC